MPFVRLAALMAVSTFGICPHLTAAVASAGTGFPSYSRQEEVQSCLYSYGMENSSIVDCVARDETYRSTLSKSWPDIDDRFKRNCVGRLAERHLNSYFYLDRGVHNAKQDAASPE